MVRSLFAAVWAARPVDWVSKALLLSAFAVIADWFAPAIFVGHSLVLGSVFYWIGLRLIGPNRALVVLAASTATLMVKWGQPYSASILAFEGLSVSWAWRHRRNPLLADLIYWVVIGTPVSWFLYSNVYVIPRPSLEHALMVQPVNGLIAVWVAMLALELMPRSGRAAVTATPVQSFRAVLLKRYIAFGTLPVLIVGLIAARTFEQRALSEARNNLRSSALHVAALVSRHVTAGLASVQEVAAQQTDLAWFTDAARLNRDLTAVHAGSGAFVTMLAADSSGRVFARALSAMGGGTTIPMTVVRDREYFTVPMNTGRSHVSGVFRGRGFGSDLLIAVSAPAISHEGERLGVVEGSLKVDTLADIIRAGSQDQTSRVLLCDQRMHIIASRGFTYPALSPLFGTELGDFITRMSPIPSRFTADFTTHKVSFLSVTVPVPGLGWTLTGQREWEDVLRPVMIIYAWTIVVALATAVIASFFATWSLRDILNAWRSLIEFSRAPSVESGLLASCAQLDLPQEFHEMLQNLSAMAQRLESAQRKRDQLLFELESRVHERTKELKQALVLAQAADHAKSVFLATVTHELRTPLTSIITGIRLLKLGGAAKSDLAVRTLATLEKSSQVLMSVISDVLDYSKLEAGGITIERRPFRPADLVTDVVAIMEAGARKGDLALRAVPRHAPELEWTGDVQRIRQVLLNLTGNAVKFTSTGSIEVSSWVADATLQMPRRLCFAVQDSGQGIPANQLESVFEPFVQLETNQVTSHAGTGLGLSICRRIVEMMGGKISATSQMGRGSTFEFWLPETVRPSD